jgi:4-azaleucine resistance transporter AzlC
MPLLLGVIPFGMIYGALAINAGIPSGITQAMSVIIFAGSAQFISIQLVHLGIPAVMIILTVGVVNLRHALYSASLAPYVKHLPARWKLVLAYLLTDEAYAVTITHYLNNKTIDNHDHVITSTQHWFFLASGLALWLTWQLSTATGIILGAIIPQDWSLDFTLALIFIAIVVPGLKDRPSIASALSAGVVAVITYSLPYKLGLIIAAFVGIFVGLWLETGQAIKCG